MQSEITVQNRRRTSMRSDTSALEAQHPSSAGTLFKHSVFQISSEESDKVYGVKKKPSFLDFHFWFGLSRSHYSHLALKELWPCQENQYIRLCVRLVALLTWVHHLACGSRRQHGKSRLSSGRVQIAPSIWFELVQLPPRRASCRCLVFGVLVHSGRPGMALKKPAYHQLEQLDLMLCSINTTYVTFQHWPESSPNFDMLVFRFFFTRLLKLDESVNDLNCLTSV